MTVTIGNNAIFYLNLYNSNISDCLTEISCLFCSLLKEYQQRPKLPRVNNSFKLTPLLRWLPNLLSLIFEIIHFRASIGFHALVTSFNISHKFKFGILYHFYTRAFPLQTSLLSQVIFDRVGNTNKDSRLSVCDISRCLTYVLYFHLPRTY